MVMIRKMKDSGIEWIGEIPEGWSIAQLKRFVIVNNGREIENEIDRSDSAIPVYGSGGVFKYTDSFMHDGKSVLFGRKGTLGKPLYVEGRFWTVDTMYFLTFEGGLHPKYNYYQLSAFDWEPHITKTALPSVVASEIVSCSFPFPSLPEQQKIADFLDAKCAKIDTIIEQTRASIEEYRKLKQSVITQAVTKGIRPGRKMKDSGNNDMGYIPNEWEIVRLKYLTTDIVDCPHETPEYSLDGEYFVIRTADQDYARLRSDANMFRLAYDQYVIRTRRMTLDKDDIVYGREGERWGLACIVPESGKYCLGQRMMQFRCDEKRILPLFAMYALSSSHVRRQGEYDTFGSTSPHVNISTIRNYRIPLPTISEQKEICEYIHEKVLHLDMLVDKKEKKVAQLESYKKSLIFEYVTGKKEVVQ